MLALPGYLEVNIPFAKIQHFGPMESHGTPWNSMGVAQWTMEPHSVSMIAQFFLSFF